MNRFESNQQNELTPSAEESAKDIGQVVGKASADALKKLSIEGTQGESKQESVRDAERGTGWQEVKPRKFPTGDTLYETPVSQDLHMKNGDRLLIQRKEGKIIRLTDKDGKEVKVPGDSENLAPANSPMEIYRLSNGAMYIKDKRSGDQTLLNTDGSKITIDSKGLLSIERGNVGVGFMREHSGDDVLELEPIYNKR